MKEDFITEFIASSDVVKFAVLEKILESVTKFLSIRMYICGVKCPKFKHIDFGSVFIYHFVDQIQVTLKK
jgi:hypothetical protein